jgi:transposase
MRVSKYRRYSDEFRSDALQLLEHSDRSLTQVAKDIGVSVFSLRAWYNRDLMAKKSRKARQEDAARATSERRAVPQSKQKLEQQNESLEREIQALRKQVASLEMDREILKKAAAFFAKESE